jgi:hypothetical protein
MANKNPSFSPLPPDAMAHDYEEFVGEVVKP